MSHTHVRGTGQENWLLAMLPDDAYARVLALCETIPMATKTIVIEPDVLIEYAHFPITGCLSVVALMKDRGRVEVGTVGWEGMSGLSFLHGVETTRTQCITQVAGTMRRITRQDMMTELGSHGELVGLLNLYADVWISQIGQGVACNGVHSIDKRLARWLLITHDRVIGDVLPLTHEFLAVMLAVRRASVTVAATALQNRRIIDYTHGKITVLDREQLEKATCECYEMQRASYEKLLPVTPD